jgi:hypothetical protein
MDTSVVSKKPSLTRLWVKTTVAVLHQIYLHLIHPALVAIPNFISVGLLLEGCHKDAAVCVGIITLKIALASVLSFFEDELLPKPNSSATGMIADIQQGHNPQCWQGILL